MKILITGFEAFGGETSNPTQDLIAALQRGEIDAPLGFEIESACLRVGFEIAFGDLENKIEEFEPDVVIAFGQAGGRDAVEFERVAINLMDADIADNQGRQPRDQRIDPIGETAYFSTLPIRAFHERLIREKIPSRISNSAGLFVCNELFYRLQTLSEMRPGMMTGFIHVPFSPQQALAKGQAGGVTPPSLDLEVLKQALALMLDELRLQRP